MNHRIVRAFTALPIAGLLVTFQPSAPAITAHALNYSGLNSIQKRILSGFAAMELNPSDPGNKTSPPNNYFPRGSGQCPVNLSSNIKANQNCLNVSDPDLQGRSQAQNETSVAINPTDTNQIIASQNDYRRGDGNCYSEYSTDNGRTWSDSTIPMSFTRGDAFGGAAREYWQAGGDTSVAWDTKGNAYLSCQVFNRGNAVSPNQDQSSAFYVFRSTQNHGASWNFPGRPVTENNDVVGVGNVLEDKQLLTVDNHVGSPFQDRVYVSWTEFAADGSAYIYEAFSSDFGEHFSPRHLVSATSAFCVNTFGAGTADGSCNENQFSQPFSGSDGSLYIAYDNYNNQPVSGTDNRYQIFLSKSTDGGNIFGPPVKISDFYDLPDCVATQGKDPGRSCVPEKGPSTNSFFRAANYPVGVVNPTNPHQVVVTFGSYINKFSNEGNGCVPTFFSPFGNPTYTGSKTAGACNNKILVSISNDAGSTFTGTAADPRAEPTVNTDPGQATTDQFWQWAAMTKNGKLAVSYYDRQYGTDETTGFSDVSLSGSGDVVNYVVQRVTSSSNPPPTQFSGTFLGDYNALAAINDAHPVWSDTRDPDLFACPTSVSATPAVCTGSASNATLANDQDIFTANQSVPSK
jgi:hypothetical protein